MSPQKKVPVVTIMGHVDHGKTSLLDYIRQSHLAAKEFGEITQTTGAYQAVYKGEKITFIDTPGHEAFTKMRSRGAGIADIVVLVVAANDGVMPQTKESIRIIQEAGVPYLVAFNKIDLPDITLDKIKSQLAESGVYVEGYGGNITAVSISAKTGQGIDQLLEMILLTAELNELSADPDGQLEAYVVESQADKFCGNIASIIVKNGTLRTGDDIVVDGASSRVRQIRDEFGKPKTAIKPGEPGQVQGFAILPAVGAALFRAGEEILPTITSDQTVAATAVVEGKLKIILKTDTTGSLEAIVASLPSEVQIMGRAVGQVNDSDVLFAKTIGAEVYSFNLAIPSAVAKLAETEQVKIKSYRIIYDLLKNIEDRILKILEPTIGRKIHGRAEVIAVFDMKGDKIAGARVTDGKINRAYKICVQRADKIIAETKIKSLKQQKQDITEAPLGTEFGLIVTDKVDFQPQDVLLSYSLEE